MSTLQEIQTLVNEAQGKIKEGKLDIVRRDLWPKIKSAVANYTDLVKEDRRKLALLIHDRLDVLGLQAGGKPVPIDVKRLTLLILERSDTTGSQVSIPPWLPF